MNVEVMVPARSVEVPQLSASMLLKVAKAVDEVVDNHVRMSTKGDVLAVVPEGVLRILQPEILLYLDTESHGKLSLLNKEAKKASESSDFWSTLWSVTCCEYGLYAPVSDGVVINRELFMTELWPHALRKWGVPTDVTGAMNVSVGDSFNVAVMARMRPGDLGKDKVNLPLHQFLKLKRRENLKAKENSVNSEEKKIAVGAEDPEEFVCPFTQTLMRDPVLLTHCNRIVEKSIVRSGRDPWSGRKLSPDVIVPQPALKRAINEWREKKGEKVRESLELDMNSVKEHIIDAQQGADPILLAALLEAEKIHQESDRLFRLGSRTGLGGKDADDDNDTPETHLNTEEAPTANADAAAATSVEGAARATGDEEEEEEEDGDNGFDRNNDGPRILDISAPKSTISMHVGGAGVKSYEFDKVFPGDTTQKEFYDKVRDKTVALALHGYNACFLAYGQTGSGKTYTFFGPDSILQNGLREDSHVLSNDTGIAMRVCADLLRAKEQLQNTGVALSINMNYIELYDEKATDLFVDVDEEVSGLSGTGGECLVRKSGEVHGAMEIPLESAEQAFMTLYNAQKRKRFSATAMNDRSSRSHSALIFHLTQVRKMATGESKMLKSCLHCVDLAGSERLRRSKATGTAKKEAATINTSLLVLGKVIEALASGKSHVPYFESKLTTLLRGAFGGNSRTTVAVCARTEDSSGSETLSTFRFSERASAINNTIKVMASSAEDTLASLNASLETIGGQIESLEERGKARFAEKLKASYTTLEKKRNELLQTMLDANGGIASKSWALKVGTTGAAAEKASISPPQQRFAVVEAQ